MRLHISVFIAILMALCVSTHQALAQCPVAEPMISDTCILRSGQVQLDVSGSTGFYLWYDSALGDNIIESGSTYSTPFLTSDRTYYVSAIETNASLTIDGDSSYIALNHSYDSAGAIPRLTVEAWVNTSVSGTSAFGNWSIIDFDRSEYFNLFVSGDNGEVGFSSTAPTGGTDDFYSSGVSVNDGNWHHIAAVYDGTDKMIYVDGQVVAVKSNPHSGQALGRGTRRFGFIGDGSEADTYNGRRNGQYYTGLVDEVRLWNDVRTPTEIIDYKNRCLSGTESGLVSYYDFNDNGGTTVNDVTGQGADGRIFNLDVSTAWGAGAFVGCTCESALVPVMVSIEGQLEDTLLSCGGDIVLDAGPSAVNYNWNTGETTQTITVTESGFYEVQTSGGRCSGTARIAVEGFTHSEDALQFDGQDDYVAIDNLRYDRADLEELTVETWIKTSDWRDQIIASFDRSEFWRLEINGDGGGSGQIGFDIRTSSGILDFGSNKRVDDGQWHHVACVFDNGRIEIYIDGVLDADTVAGSTFGANVVRYGFLGIGSEANSFNGFTGPNSRFDGQMDEFKIWSRALSQLEIRTNMSKHISGNSDGLQVYYKFDDIFQNTIFDHNTRVQDNATMYRFGAGARVTSTAPIGDESVFRYTGSWTGESLSLAHCSGESLTVSDMGGRPSGVHIYYVGRVPDDVSGILGLGSNDRYYGVHKIDDPSASYTATYDYTGSHASAMANEQQIVLYSRTDRSDSPWANTEATLDEVANTLTTTASSTEFIMGSSGTPLPIELLTFEAEINGDKVDIRWVTTAEIDNDYFNVERSKDGQLWEEVAVVSGAGNSSYTLSYAVTDHQPIKGVSYYRLRQTDFDGQYSLTDPVALYIGHVEMAEVMLFPNPVVHGGRVHIELLGIRGSDASVTLRDLSGQLIFQKVMAAQSEEGSLHMNFDTTLPAGVYMVTLRTASQVSNQRLVVN